jgi:hypothetical protein
MVRIEKAYTGYCIHQEEASQTMQELEKNEAVKLWLEVQPDKEVTENRNVSDGVRIVQKRGIFIHF